MRIIKFIGLLWACVTFFYWDTIIWGVRIWWCNQPINKFWWGIFQVSFFSTSNICVIRSSSDQTRQHYKKKIYLNDGLLITHVSFLHFHRNVGSILCRFVSLRSLSHTPEGGRQPNSQNGWKSSLPAMPTTVNLVCALEWRENERSRVSVRSFIFPSASAHAAPLARPLNYCSHKPSS